MGLFLLFIGTGRVCSHTAGPARTESGHPGRWAPLWLPFPLPNSHPSHIPCVLSEFWGETWSSVSLKKLGQAELLPVLRGTCGLGPPHPSLVRGLTPGPGPLPAPGPHHLLAFAGPPAGATLLIPGLRGQLRHWILSPVMGVTPFSGRWLRAQSSCRVESARQEGKSGSGSKSSRAIRERRAGGIEVRHPGGTSVN